MNSRRREQKARQRAAVATWLKANATRRRAALLASQRQRRPSLEGLERDGLHAVVMQTLCEEIALTWPTR